MALTKGYSVVHDDITLTAGAGDTTSATEDISSAYQATVRVRLTNGATGPTTPAQCKVQIAELDTAAKFMTIATVVGLSSANGIVEQEVAIPDTAIKLRTVSGSNTGQNVTERVVLEKVTAY